MKCFIAANDHIIMVGERMCRGDKPDGLLKTPFRAVPQNCAGALSTCRCSFFPQSLAGHDEPEPRMSGQRLILRQDLQQECFSRPFAATPDAVEIRPAFQSLQPQ